jgi:hypothetical protein
MNQDNLVDWDEMTDLMRDKAEGAPTLARKCLIAFVHIRFALSDGSYPPSDKLRAFVDEMVEICNQAVKTDGA